MPCDTCNKLILISKLKYVNGKYYCMDCYAELIEKDANKADDIHRKESVNIERSVHANEV